MEYNANIKICFCSCLFGPLNQNCHRSTVENVCFQFLYAEATLADERTHTIHGQGLFTVETFPSRQRVSSIFYIAHVYLYEV